MLVPRSQRGRRHWLVVRRPEPPHEWSIPGGHIEVGESPAAAALRELKEETAVQAVGLVPVGIMREGDAPIYVFIAPRSRGRGSPAEGLPVSWMTWPAIRAQAQNYGWSLDAISQTLRARGVGL